jgi:aspartate racemase
VSIVDATVRNACRAKYKKVLLTGTLFTMENTFYSDAFDAKGIRCVVPEKHERLVIQNIIFPNLEDGIVDPVQKKTFIDICEQIIAKEKTDAVILGCTELPMLVNPYELSVPSIDTLEAHVELILDTLFS